MSAAASYTAMARPADTGSSLCAAAVAGDMDGAPGAGAGRTVTVSADLLDRIVKTVDILLETYRREAMRAGRCRGCDGEADYQVEYDGIVSSGETARVCEKCMESSVVHKHGMDIYTWKHGAKKVTCVRCGDDVTARGWCVCPRNSVLARSESAPGGSASNSAGGGGQ